MRTNRLQLSILCARLREVVVLLLVLCIELLELGLIGLLQLSNASVVVVLGPHVLLPLGAEVVLKALDVPLQSLDLETHGVGPVGGFQLARSCLCGTRSSFCRFAICDGLVLDPFQLDLSHARRGLGTQGVPLSDLGRFDLIPVAISLALDGRHASFESFVRAAVHLDVLDVLSELIVLVDSSVIIPTQRQEGVVHLVPKVRDIKASARKQTLRLSSAIDRWVLISSRLRSSFSVWSCLSIACKAFLLSSSLLKRSSSDDLTLRLSAD
jgi:hypothetical protein